MRCGRLLARADHLPGAARHREGDRLERRLAGRLCGRRSDLFVTTHYYAVLLLPVHALILFAWLARRNLAAGADARPCCWWWAAWSAAYGA